MRFLLITALMFCFSSLFSNENFNADILEINEDFEIDANPFKEPWAKQNWNHLKYADTKIAGMAKINPKKFKLSISNEYLYVLFSGTNLSIAKNEPLDQIKFMEEPQFGFWVKSLKNQHPLYFVSISTAGQATHATIKGEEYDFNWNPTVQSKTKSFSNELIFEIKIKLDSLDFIKTDEAIAFNFFAKETPGLYIKNRANDLNHFIWAPSLDFKTYAVSSLGFGNAKRTKISNHKKFPNIGINEVGVKKLAIDADTIRNGLKRKDLVFVPKSTGKISIDGKLDEKDWLEFDKNNIVAPLKFFDPLFIYPPEINKTYFKVLADSENIFVGFICDENNMPGLISNSEALWADDIVDFLFDLEFGQSIFSDSYFILENNPIGKFNTALGNQKQWKPTSFEVKHSHEKNRWVIEFKIAWKDLGVLPNEIPIICGANFLRFRANERGGYKDIAISNTEFSWVGNYIGDPHIPTKFGLLYFEQGNLITTNISKALGIKNDLNSKIKLQKTFVVSPKIEEIPVINRNAKLISSKVTNEAEDKIKLEFSVTNEIDITVNIINNKGQVVCHLASGVVGENAPSPFQKGLKQILFWDYTNDFSQKVSKSDSYQVDIKLGMGLKFDKIIVGDPQKLSSVLGMNLDKDGNLIVLNETKGHGHYRSYHIIMYDRNGKFKQEILPPSSTLDYESVKGISPIQLSDKKWMPVMYKPMLHAYIPQLPALKRQSPIISTSGHIYLVNSITEVLLNFPHRIIKVGLNGSVKEDYLGPILSEEFIGGTTALALSTDEKTIFVTGLEGNSRWGGTPHNTVYKVRLDKDDYEWQSEYRKPFIGELFVTGEKNLLNSPRDIAVNNHDDIIIADQNNNRIAIFDKDGVLKKEIPCGQPIGVEYSNKYEYYYVLRETKDGRQIVKFDKKGSAVCRVDLPPMAKNAPSFICIDDKEERVVIHYLHSSSQIKQFVDTGYNFVEKGDFISNHIAPHETLDRSNNFDSFEISHDGEKLFLTSISAYGYGKNYDVFDSKTGQPLPYDRIYQWGADGNLYSKDHGLSESISRFNANFEPIPFKNGKTIEAKLGLPFTVDREGNIFVPLTQGVKKFNRDGELVNNTFIKVSLPSKTGASVSSFAQDKEGQFYILSPIKNKDELIPSFFKNKLPEDKDVFPGPNMEYSFYYSSILKFQSEGGSSFDDVNSNLLEGRGYSGLYPVKLTGLVWSHQGVSPYNYRTTNHARCVCEHGKFHMSKNDLIYYTDAMRYSIVIIDKNQNEIKRIGEYGNNNSFTPNSMEPKIGFSWPTCIKTNDEACFISDKVNRRIIRLNYTFQDMAKLTIEKNN